jgi:hypothetical protein
MENKVFQELMEQTEELNISILNILIIKEPLLQIMVKILELI